MCLNNLLKDSVLERLVAFGGLAEREHEQRVPAGRRLRSLVDRTLKGEQRLVEVAEELGAHGRDDLEAFRQALDQAYLKLGMCG